MTNLVDGVAPTSAAPTSSLATIMRSRVLRDLSPSSRLVLIAVVSALVVVVVAGSRSLRSPPTAVEPTPTDTAIASPAPSPSSSRGPTPSAPTTQRPSARAGTFALGVVLATLLVAAEDRTGYDRSLFRHWIDADGDGCDAGREVLIQEALVAPTISAGCVLSGGEWSSAYDGFTFSNPSDLDVDHVVALAEAWDSGASGWDPARRESFANDLGVRWSLIAVSAWSNTSKSDKDPADWMPPLGSFRCSYLANWVAVKARWGLAVDSLEKSVIGAYSECQSVPVEVVRAE